MYLSLIQGMNSNNICPRHDGEVQSISFSCVWLRPGVWLRLVVCLRSVVWLRMVVWLRPGVWLRLRCVVEDGCVVVVGVWLR